MLTQEEIFEMLPNPSAMAGTTEERNKILALLPQANANARCAIFGAWISSAWVELDRHTELHTIRNDEMSWEATHTQRFVECPFCNHTVGR